MVVEAQVQANVMSYNSIINACAQQGDAKITEQWVEWMETHAQPDVTSYTSIINACPGIVDARLRRTIARSNRKYFVLGD